MSEEARFGRAKLCSGTEALKKYFPDGAKLSARLGWHSEGRWNGSWFARDESNRQRNQVGLPEKVKVNSLGTHCGGYASVEDSSTSY